MNLKDWFNAPVSTLIGIADWNAPCQSDGLLGGDPIVPIPPPQDLYDLAQYSNPKGVLWNRPATTLTAG